MKSKCLNAKTTSFSHLGFELRLAFELCHLTLFRILGLSRLNGDWPLIFEFLWGWFTAEGGTRTHTPFTGKRILSPPRLPFRHLGLMIDSWKRRRADSNRRIGVLQTPALTSWLHRRNYQIYWSGRRDSNPRPLPWQGSILPLNYFRSE